MLLARHASNDDDLFWVSVRTMAAKTGGNKSTICRFLKEFCEAGLIEDTGERRNRGAVVYRFCYPGQPVSIDNTSESMTQRSANGAMNGHYDPSRDLPDDRPDDARLYAPVRTVDASLSRVEHAWLKSESARDCTLSPSRLYAFEGSTVPPRSVHKDNKKDSKPERQVNTSVHEASSCTPCDLQTDDDLPDFEARDKTMIAEQEREAKRAAWLAAKTVRKARHAKLLDACLALPVVRREDDNLGNMIAAWDSTGVTPELLGRFARNYRLEHPRGRLTVSALHQQIVDHLADIPEPSRQQAKELP
ncbi:hypothetical protein PQR34_43990 [Paraburkholderia sediminicola]|uniref:hypothetical protein n=1 Tax=Paraburkholderia sediminicola TaxID=458836 RepID=UPI0038B90DB8